MRPASPDPADRSPDDSGPADDPRDARPTRDAAPVCPECGGPSLTDLDGLAQVCPACRLAAPLDDEERRAADALLAEFRRVREAALAPPSPRPKRTRPRPASSPAAHSASSVAEDARRGTRPVVGVRPSVASRDRSATRDDREPVDLIPDPVETLLRTPSWLVSLGTHLILVIVLALIWIRHEPPRRISLSLRATLAPAEPRDDPGAEPELDETSEFAAPGDFAPRVETPPTPEPPTLDDPAPPSVPEVNAPVAPRPTRPAVEPPPAEPRPTPVSRRERRAPRETPGDVANRPLPNAVLRGRPGSFDGRRDEARGELVEFYGGTPESESAVAKGLRWLASAQEADGSWRLDRWGGVESDAAATGLGVLPFLGAGQTHQSGQYQQTVAKAIAWLRANQGPDGDVRDGLGRMYDHSLCAIALCEAYGLTQDPELKRPAQRAIDFIVAGQHFGGGWRYAKGMPGDLSVSGWQIMALRSAQLAYLDVPPDAIERAVGFLDSTAVRDRTSRYGAERYAYTPGLERPTASMTAVAMLCRQYTGWTRRDPEMEAAVRWLLSEHAPRVGRAGDLYYLYYATQTMHHFGGEPWRAWNRLVRDAFVKSQVRDGPFAGSWEPDRGWCASGGRICSTSLSILTLEVYYRHLPLYDRPERDVRGD